MVDLDSVTMATGEVRRVKVLDLSQEERNALYDQMANEGWTVNYAFRGIMVIQRWNEENA